MNAATGVLMRADVTLVAPREPPAIHELHVDFKDDRAAGLVVPARIVTETAFNNEGKATYRNYRRFEQPGESSRRSHEADDARPAWPDRGRTGNRGRTGDGDRHRAGRPRGAGSRRRGRNPCARGAGPHLEDIDNPLAR